MTYDIFNNVLIGWIMKYCVLVNHSRNILLPVQRMLNILEITVKEISIERKYLYLKEIAV